MSKIRDVYLLSDYRISETDKTMKSIIEKVNEFEKKKKFYFALYYLENLILQDGTNEKYTYRFLNLILDHYDDILKDIKCFPSEIQLKEEEEDNNEDKNAINDAKNYNFFYFRDCFDKYEVSLNQHQLKIICEKKKKHNNKIIKIFPELNQVYLKLINDIESEESKISADEIYFTIKNLNEKIPDQNESKLFYIYKYLDIELINNNKIFKYLSEDKFYLNQFSFGHFNKLGIPIGYSKNEVLKYRYLFLLLKKKINNIEEQKQIEIQKKIIEEDKNKKVENEKKSEENDKVEEKEEKINEIDNKMEENDEKINEIDNKIEEKEEKINEIDNKIEENDEKINEIDNKIEEKDINIIEEKNKKKTIKKKIEEEDKSIEFVFSTFKTIFMDIKKNRFEFIKYFVLIFINVIFEGNNNIAEIYKNGAVVSFSYFRILCEQFHVIDNKNAYLISLYEELQNKKIIFEKKQSKIDFNNKQLVLNEEEYSINSFIINLTNRLKYSNEILLVNSSKKFLCKEKIYGDYFDEFIKLLKKIACSNIATIMQSLHDEFKQFKTFYKKKSIMNDLFDRRLKFYPYECNTIYGITDKYFMEVYLSSIYMNNFISFPLKLKPYFKEILYIFNMALNSVIFQHEALNHYVRAYLSYYDYENRKISIDTKTSHLYYPIQKLNLITIPPNYLNKFLHPLNKNELDELKKISNLDYKNFLEECLEKDLKDGNQDIQFDDEGYYYERQLFTLPDEKKLTKFNFLQALMLIDEDAYNLDPVHFHYCFLQLKDNNKYSFIKENFKSPLLVKLLKNIDSKFKEELKKISFFSKRGADDGLNFYFERSLCDEMSSYAS